MTRTDRHDRLARGHRCPGAELPSGLGSIQLVYGLEGPEARPHGAFGIIGMCRRSAEHGHDCVADELLHGPTEPLDLVLDAAVVLLQEIADVLGVRAIGSRRETDQVDEQDRDDLALFPGLGGAAEGCSARGAEPGLFGVLLATLPAGDHEGRLSGGPLPYQIQEGASSRTMTKKRPSSSPSQAISIFPSASAIGNRTDRLEPIPPPPPNRVFHRRRVQESAQVTIAWPGVSTFVRFVRGAANQRQPQQTPALLSPLANRWQ